MTTVNEIPKELRVKKRQTHNYTSSLELSSLLIRIKNTRIEGSFVNSVEHNQAINKAIKLHSLMNSKKYKNPDHARARTVLRNKLRDKITNDSELVLIDEGSYERFGEVILLMIKRILTKPQFSGYTYKDDFYSDAVYKIIKYLHNYNHRLISERTNQPVNAFAYISQYIHNSVLYIINRKKVENDNLRELVRTRNQAFQSSLRSMDLASFNAVDKHLETEQSDADTVLVETVQLSNITSLTEEVIGIKQLYEGRLGSEIGRINIVYPIDYVITFDEYNSLKEELNQHISIIRSE